MTPEDKQAWRSRERASSEETEDPLDKNGRPLQLQQQQPQQQQQQQQPICSSESDNGEEQYNQDTLPIHKKV